MIQTQFFVRNLVTFAIETWPDNLIKYFQNIKEYIPIRLSFFLDQMYFDV